MAEVWLWSLFSF